MRYQNFILILVTFTLGMQIYSCKHDHKHHDHKQQNSHAHTEHEHNDKKHKGHHHGKANEHMHQSSFEDLVQNFESDERNAYQKPSEVLDYLGDINGKKIIDIGAGSGYFTFRMVDAGAELIAADVDDRFLEYIGDRKKENGITDDQLTLRKVPYDSPSLTDNEVDMAIIVNTYHHIENRIPYFQKVKSGLKDGGRLVVIDFVKKEVPVGPPVEMKISADQILKELTSAGFEAFEVNNELLPYQFIITAR